MPWCLLATDQLRSRVRSRGVKREAAEIKRIAAALRLDPGHTEELAELLNGWQPSEYDECPYNIDLDVGHMFAPPSTASSWE